MPVIAWRSVIPCQHYLPASAVFADSDTTTMTGIVSIWDYSVTMRASRLLAILIHLQLHHRVSASQLAREFQVSKRTIYRDIDELSSAGIPVYAEPGRDGGFALIDGYRTRLTGLTESEALAAALLHAQQVAADLGLGAAARSAHAKVLASLPPASARQAADMGARIHVDVTGWYRPSATPQCLPILQTALSDCRQISFSYQSWQRQARHSAGPLGLVLKAGSWYLVATKGNRVATYKVESITDLIVHDSPVRRPERFDLATYWAGSTKAFEDAISSQTATVRLSALGRRRLEQIRRTNLDAFVVGPCDSDGWVSATIPLECNPHGVGEVLQLGGEAEVLEPAQLRDAVATAAAAILAAHQS